MIQNLDIYAVRKLDSIMYLYSLDILSNPMLYLAAFGQRISPEIDLPQDLALLKCFILYIHIYSACCRL